MFHSYKLLYWHVRHVRRSFLLTLLSIHCPNPNYNFSVLQSITTAHRDWICGLALVPRSSSPGGGVLVSACRAGTLRTWSLTNSTFLGETQGHVGPINAICTNSTLVFTASTSVYLRFHSVYIRFIRKKTSVDKPLLEYMNKKLNVFCCCVGLLDRKSTRLNSSHQIIS